MGGFVVTRDEVWWCGVGESWVQKNPVLLGLKSEFSEQMLLTRLVNIIAYHNCHSTDPYNQIFEQSVTELFSTPYVW